MQIQLLEEKRSFSKSDVFAVETKNGCKTLSLALEEVHHKGTLMERLAILEKRVLEVGLCFKLVYICNKTKHKAELLRKNEDLWISHPRS